MAAQKPSPLSPIPPSRPNPNPSARNSETKDSMRRSFSGNPFAKPTSIVPNSRGGGFNPNTPANSPSDFHRRSSIGRENPSSLRYFEDKENSKDSNSKAAKVRSPASASKGTKNFMSPTISAASKFATSPRKKILVERNEAARSSVSFSDVRLQALEDNNSKSEVSLGKKKTVTFSDVKDLIMEENDFSKPEIGLNQNEFSHESTITDLGLEETANSCSMFYSEVLFNTRSDISSSSKAVTEEKDCVNLDPTFRFSPQTSCPPSSPIVAPLDADPLMPPYDPKTNYLSPRPQFLHYRPNPRIESMLNKVKDGKQQLDESFASENSSDSEVGEILSEDSQKESEDISSDETVKETRAEEEDKAVEGEENKALEEEEEENKAVEGEENKALEEEEEEEEEEELNVSEPNPFCTHRPEETVQAKGERKSKFMTRSMYMAFLVVVAFVCLSISTSDYQVTDLSLSNLYIPPEIAEFANVKFEEVVQNAQLWSAKSFTYICKLISHFRGMHQLGYLQYSNLTVLLEKDHLVDGYLKFGQIDAAADLKYENDVLAPTREGDVESDSMEEEGHEEIEDDKTIEEILEEENSLESEEQVVVHNDTNEVPEDHTESQSDKNMCSTSLALVIKPDNSKAEQTQETVESDVQSDTDLQDLAKQHLVISEVTPIQPDFIENKLDVAVSEVTGIQPVVSSAWEPQGETDAVSNKAEDTSEMDASVGNVQNSATSNGSEDNYLTKNVVGISLSMFLSLLVATAYFTYAKKGKPSTPTDHHQPAHTKKLDNSPITVSIERTFLERLTEVDMVGESCPSEMSSFKVSSHIKKGIQEYSEAQSQERKQKQQQQLRKSYRRESLASSDFSMGSPSYGSFTTYEKISTKISKRCGDDEVVTPVRRSSRIRNQVTSS